MIGTKPRRPQNGTSPPPTSVRVAIYTRQSVADDLEFNSLEAQRQAVESYVEAQRSQGWEALSERYDDHGFSGGTIERPAFQRLLKDVEAGKADVVAVHRLDRLSRSINDFVRVMEFLSEHGASLVSTTQAFDTGTSLGRMTVNLLATFATYERDMIRERTQEKMAASRKRGLWVGGVPVLGYDLKEKKLVLNTDEAERVRQIFRLYLSHGSLLAVAEELNRRGSTTKARVSGEGKRVAGGKAWDKDAVRRILTNVTYLGKVLYHGEVFDGQHEVIIDQETWDAVQRLLRDHAGVKERRDRTSGALLGGLLRCGICGQAMGHHFAVKKGRRYGSYVCQTIQKQGAAACPGSRVPLRELEGFVVEKIMAIGRDPRLVAETLKAARKQLEARTPEILAELRCHEKDREKLDRERRHLVDAVGKGKASPAILQRLGEQDLLAQSLEAQVAKLKDELAAMESKVIDEADLRRALSGFAPIWSELFPQEKVRILRLLIDRVTYDARAGEVEIVFRPGGVRTLAGEGGKA